MSELTPIERYLGLEATRGPVEILGLPTADCVESQVLDALRTRLNRVSRHALGRSVEADEVRLALHAAAAQLLDPHVRAYLLGGSAESAMHRETEPAAESDAGVRRLSEQELEVFRHNAMALLRRSGGWNRQSMQYVAGLAHAMGIPMHELSRALHLGPLGQNGTAGQAGQAEQQKAVAGGRVGHARRARARAKRSRPLMALVGVMGGVGIVLILALGILSSLRPPRVEEVVATQSTRAVVDAPRGGGDGVPDTALRVGADNLLETLAQARKLLADDPGESGWRFERAVSWHAAHWTSLDEDSLFVVREAIGGYLEDVPVTSSVWRRSIDAVAAPAIAMVRGDREDFDPVGAVWSVGFLQGVRLQGGLESRLVDESVSVLLQVFGGRIPRSQGEQQALVDALEVTIAWIIPDAGVGTSGVLRQVVSWRQCLARVVQPDDRERLALVALERMLHHGPSISRRRDARDAALFLLGDMSWNVPSGVDDASASVESLLRWFEDPGVSTRDLSVVTQWLSHDVRGPGLPSTYILTAGASESTRAAVRERIAEFWFAGVLDSDSPRSKWRSRVAAHLSEPMDDDPVALMGDIARSGRLLEAGYLLWARRQDESQTVLTRSWPGVSPDNSHGVEGDMAWMLAYTANRESLQGRLDAIRMLEDRQGLLAQGEADFLAELAMEGTPTEVRRRAQWIVRARRGESAMLRGILEALPGNRWRADAMELLEDIAGGRMVDREDDQWPVMIRRAVVSRLFEALAREQPMGQGELYVGELIESTRAMLEDAQSLAGDDVPSGEVLYGLVRRLRQSWEAEAQRYDPNPLSRVSLDEIRQRRLGRMKLAAGPIQRFAVEQMSLVELLGFVLIAERPDAVAHVERVQEALVVARSEAGSILVQAALTHRALLRLWWIRLGFPALERDGQFISKGES